MAILSYASIVLSTLFRLAAFIFLRVFPGGWGKTVLPGLYFLYFVTSFFADRVKEGQKPETWSEKYAKLLLPQSPSGPRENLRTIVFSLPSSSRRLRMINQSVNAILLLCAFDFVARPFLDSASSVTFTRVGAVYSDSAKIVIRYPQPNVTDYKLRIIWRQSHNAPTEKSHPWRGGPVLTLSKDQDWVNTAKLSRLWPGTTYEYKLSLTNKTILPYPSLPIQFRTFPDPGLGTGSRFRFVVSSCSLPNFPYLPFQGQRIKGFDLLARYLFPRRLFAREHKTYEKSLERSVSGALPDSTGATPSLTPASPSSRLVTSPSPSAEFLLFLGDFIYADTPTYIGDSKEAYRRLYRLNYQSSSFRKIYERLPVFHTYDDHEFLNDFAGQGNDSISPYVNASDAYNIYHGHGNYDSPDKGQSYYDFRYGDVTFFVMDTRRYRSDLTTGDIASHTMLGDKQLAAFYHWLVKANSTASFKFVVTSVPFTSLWEGSDWTDSWAAFTSEKTSILDALHSVPNVIILSGDRHQFAAVEFNGDSAQKPIVEISTSPMSMFDMPFPMRALRKQSKQTTHRSRTEIRTATNGTEDVVTVIDELPRERVLKYIAGGNYKWSAIEVDTTDFTKPTLRLEVMISGEPKYHLEVVGSPVKPYSSMSLGAFVPGGLKSMLHNVGIRQKKWF